MVPYTLRTALLAFVDDMAVVTANARQPLHTASATDRAERVLHDFTHYLESNMLMVQDVKSTTMTTRNAPPPAVSAH